MKLTVVNRIHPQSKKFGKGVKNNRGGIIQVCSNLSYDLKRKLESNWQVIRDEGLSVLDKKSGGFIPEEENLREQGDWKQFTLYQRGRKSEAACQKTPQTCAIIDTMRDATGCKRGQVSV